MKQVVRAARTVLSDRLVPIRDDFYQVPFRSKLREDPASNEQREDLGAYRNIHGSDSFERQDDAYSR